MIPLVECLRAAGIVTLQSCSGHPGTNDGHLWIDATTVPDAAVDGLDWSPFTAVALHLYPRRFWEFTWLPIGLERAESSLWLLPKLTTRLDRPPTGTPDTGNDTWVNEGSDYRPPTGPPGRLPCPDGGTCHHDCSTRDRCWRVDNAAPLSGVYPDDKWPTGTTDTDECEGCGRSDDSCFNLGDDRVCCLLCTHIGTPEAAARWTTDPPGAVPTEEPTP
jgi:hypothetical protein